MLTQTAESLNWYNLIQVLSPKMTEVLLWEFIWVIILSASTCEARKVLRMLPEEKIYDPVMRDYILWVVIVGLPTLDFARNVFLG